MTIDRAIEILTIWRETGEAQDCKDLAEAEKLSIEALKAVKSHRENPQLRDDIYLEGETEKTW